MKFNKFSSIFALFLILFSVGAFAQVSITPNPAASNVNLVCGITGGNSAAYVYKWFLQVGNTWQQQAYTTNTISNAVTSPLQNWNCQVLANIPGYNVPVGQASVTITNTPPVASITSFQNGTEGSTQINFTGTASDNVDYDTITSYSWNFGDGASSNSQNTNHIYLNNGTYTVTFAATDSNNGQGTTTAQIVIADRNPIVNFSITSNTFNEGGFVNFTDLTASYDPIASWQWYLNGALILNSTLNITNLRTNNGTYVLNLSMTDIDGSVGSAVKNITINDLSPTANFTTNITTLNEGQYVEFNDISATPWDSIIAWLWDFGDGSTSVLQNNSHQYLSNKTFNVNLTVTDIDGSTSIVTKTIIVNDIGPFANFTVSTNDTITGQPITFISTSYSFPDTIVAYQWIFGAGNATQNYTYSTPGNKSIFLLITDSDGSTDQAGPTRINVRNAPILPPKNYSILFDSVQNSSATINRGNITFNAVSFTLPNTTLITNNTYALSFTPSNGFSFLRWNATGGIRVVNNFTISTNMIVTGNGSIAAIYYNNTGAPVIHDVRISTTFPTSFNGIRISNRTEIMPAVPITNLMRGQNYTLQYNIINDGPLNETTRVIVYAGSVQLADYLRNISSSFSTPPVVFNASVLPLGLHNITLNVTIVGFADATPANNLAYRTVNIVNATAPPINDTIAPIISAINYSGLTNESAVINWTTNENANSTVNYGLLQSLGTFTRNPAFGLLHSITIIDLLPSTTYYLNISSYDVFGNEKINGTLTFTTNANPLPGAPLISGIVVASITNESASINWTTDIPSNTSVKYGTSLSLGTTAFIDNSVLAHNRSLSNLQPSTTYYFNVTSCANSVCSVAGNSFLTSASPTIADTISPASVFNLLVQNVTNSTIRWNWTNPQDADFNSTKISIFVTLTPIVNLTLPKLNNTYTISGLTANTTYRIIVLTQDNATIKNVNNTVVSNLTRTLVSPPIIPVNSPPVLAPIGNKNTNENQLLTFTVSATDAELDTLTFSTTTLPSGAVFNVLNATARTFTWTPSFTQTGAYSITFNVTDGTSIDQETITITVANVVQNGTIAGYVFDGLLGLSGANIFVKNNTETLASGTSNPTYTIPVRTGIFSLLVTKPGFLDQTILNVPVAEFNTTYRNITLVSLPTLGNLSGTITDLNNNIYKATVELRQGLAVIAARTTGQDGKYNFTSITNGPYALVVTKPSFVDSSNSITINAGANTRDVQLTPSASSAAISGRVLSGLDGTTPIITNVTILKPIDGAVQIVQTDASGNYQINGLSITAGFTYNITATIKTPTYTQVFPLSGISVNSGQTLTDKNIYQI